mmetsp:Transcript_9578/g.14091  ORF Transcript_9578/g.14091 Transcript_9578/m.14091 type:complete len:96 (+) Transcript_9578:2234-2521(+)
MTIRSSALTSGQPEDIPRDIVPILLCIVVLLPGMRASSVFLEKFALTPVTAELAIRRLIIVCNGPSQIFPVLDAVTILLHAYIIVSSLFGQRAIV